MLSDDLFAEAERQLNICNSCRYCAGYCPVWPALELRTQLTVTDVTHLSNLCHDCQDCFTACMYSPPHEFAVNPPQVFASVREETYGSYVWPAEPPAALRGRRGVLAAFLGSAVLVAVLALLMGESSVVDGSHTRSPYELIPHFTLAVIVLIPTIFTLLVMARAAWRYWRDIGGTLAGLTDLAAWTRTFGQAATLRHQTGGQEGCSYPDGEPAGARRRFHHMVAYGFLLTFVSTVSAFILETFLDSAPPYDVVSVPVLSGTIGGVLASVGCVGLLVLKRRADVLQSTESMRRADHALLWALLALMLSGLAVLVLRATPVFGPVLGLHLATVIVAFAIAPYTKFFHWVYRVLSIQYDNRESRRRASA
ncbi:tricarballylate utilization 4Fe-4S protein TcuB [Actinomadura syzygii]|uniref:Tricarballylate utilization 4Fe-4S protein TcuB n=1 Tax=Actinomadura syzygii TaxID=1427538 RepID=A0A5D0U618_9ACTN|nr:tricarballylate utilization 4Fe-4S protein TcuB [Actinomadura syzygii]TYC13185.1 tricarballylate utilization 4Fe-4S protein TcuB [Actinomadura syzygii]